MSKHEDRVREHPEDRFAAAALQYDLGQETEALRAEAAKSKAPGHRQRTLYKGSDIESGPTTIALFDFDAGASLPAHHAAGVVSIQVLDGRITVEAADEAHDLGTGQVLVLAPGVRHDVRAAEASQMLLTVCLESDRPGQGGGPDGD